MNDVSDPINELLSAHTNSSLSDVVARASLSFFRSNQVSFLTDEISGLRAESNASSSVS